MRYIFALIILFTTLSQGQVKGIHVGNGGGFSEYNLQIAYQSYGEWLLHLKTHDKTIAPSETEILLNLLMAVPSEKGGLVFNEQYTSLLFSEGKIGSIIYVNSKMLSMLSEQRKRDLTLSEAYGLIVRQLASHITDITDSTTKTHLDSLIRRVETATDKFVSSSTAYFKSKEILRSYAWSSADNTDQLILTSKDFSFIDLTEGVLMESHCDMQNLKALKILEPSFATSESATAKDEVRIQMNFYIKITCGFDYYLREVSAQFVIDKTQFNFVSMQSRGLF